MAFSRSHSFSDKIHFSRSCVEIPGHRSSVNILATASSTLASFHAMVPPTQNLTSVVLDTFFSPSTMKGVELWPEWEISSILSRTALESLCWA